MNMIIYVTLNLTGYKLQIANIPFGIHYLYKPNFHLTTGCGRTEICVLQAANENEINKILITVKIRLVSE
jgi:hypothetical protein